MPLRKRRKNLSEESDWQSSSKEDARPQHRSKNSSERKTGVEDDPCIVISDSDGEDSKEENGMPQKRPRLQLDRRRTGCKRRIAQMTEEEQFALAVKISEQEVNHYNYSPEEENEILRKAIEESLNSCKISDIPKEVSAEQIERIKKEDSSDKEDDICSAEHNEKLPSSQCSGQGHSKSPVVRLTRLSQDIVESSSIILSPNGKDLFSETESEACTPCLSNTSEFVSNPVNNSFPLSPVLPRYSLSLSKLVPRKLFQGTNPNSVGLHEDIDDQLSHCSESSPPDSASLLPISPPRFMKEDSLSQNTGLNGKGALCNGNSTRKYKACISPSSTDVSVQESVGVQQYEGSVHYYWGVPFCPKGADPNVYTQVILCQLEVYQKSLKKAQRQLLNKMDYGEPIELSASSSQHSEERKEDSQGSVSQEEPDDPRDEGCSHKPIESEGEGTENSENLLMRRVLSRKRQFANKMNSPRDGENSLTQEDPSCSFSQTLFPETNLTEYVGDDPVAVSESAPSQTDNVNGNNPADLKEDVQAAEEGTGEEEEEITFCPETQPSPPSPAEENKPEMEKVDEPEECSSVQSVTVDPPPPEETEVPQDVDCPLCGQQFSSSQIEIHAAYCDGTTENDKQDLAVLRSSHRLSKRNFTLPNNDDLPTSDSGKSEKCYLCQTFVQMGDYKTHVDNCLTKAALETPSSRRLRSTKRDPTKHTGKLLSMLDESEAGSAAAHSSLPALNDKRISPPREEEPESLNNEHVAVSDSPIRSFVSISEATDCLVDFKKQFSRQPGGRGPRHQAKGQRRRR